MLNSRFYNSLSIIERTTFQILIASTICNGFFACHGQISDIIARKSLHALDWQLTLLTMIWPVSNFFSIYWGKLLETKENKAPFFIFTAIFGRLILVLGLWIQTMNQFLLLMTIVFSFNSLLIPAQNSIYQNNIKPDKRGKTFGIITSIATLIGMLLSYPAGQFLDSNSDNFRYIMFVVGITSFFSSFLLAFAPKSQIKITNIAEKASIKEIILSPLVRTFKLLKRKPEFAHFQLNFTLYGMGFISMAPVIPIYMVDYLHLSFTSSFVAKAIVSQIGILIFSPIFGALHDKMHPHKFTYYSFGLLAFFPGFFLLSFLTLPYSEDIAITLMFVAYIIFGVAMSGVNVAWNMSSIYFAEKEDASMYQSVHVTFTGFRGLFAPLLSLLLLRFFGIQAVFIASILFLSIASYSSLCGYKRHRSLK